MKYFLLLTLLSSLSAQVLAEIHPVRSKNDYRMRHVKFHADNVIRMTAFYGYLTEIVLDPKETIQGTPLFGDPNAWNYEIRQGYRLFIQPKEQDAHTNLTVITNKRVYRFVLEAKWPNGPTEAMITVSFQYPPESEDPKVKQLRALLAKQEAQRLKIKQSLNTANALTKAVNYNYWVRGDAFIAPNLVYDNNKFVVMHFPDMRDMPAIYTVDEEGKEALVNVNTVGENIQIHKLAAEYRLRRGNYVASIYNQSYSLNRKTMPNTDTISTNVIRTLKGGAND